MKTARSDCVKEEDSLAERTVQAERAEVEELAAGAMPAARKETEVMVAAIVKREEKLGVW